jgi:phage baseplate assembly protein W
MVLAVTPITLKKELYSDFHNDFTKNPLTNDIARKTNEEAVKQSIRNIILTNKGERPFQPEFGSNIRNMLFENTTPDRLIIMKDIIREAIENYESRANIISVDVIANYDSNVVIVFIVFNVINIETPITLEVFLERIR